MQTIYTFSYNPAIATGTNTTGTNWRMAYQQPIMLYKGTSNSFRIVVFNVKQKVVDLTNYEIQVQIVDKETKEHFVTKTAIITEPTSGVATVIITDTDLKFLQNRFYHLIAKLTSPGDGSSLDSGEILYLDDNYGAFTPITIEDAWNFSPTSISTVDGIPAITFTNIGQTPDSLVGQANKILRVSADQTTLEFVDISVLPVAAGTFTSIGETPDSFSGQAKKFVRVNDAETAVEFGNFLAFDSTILPDTDLTHNIGARTHRWNKIFTYDLDVGNIDIYNNIIETDTDSILFSANTQRLELIDNSTDPTHYQGDGGFITFNDSTHTEDGPRIEIWYGDDNAPVYDPPGQHSLDIHAAPNSYVEFASYDLKSFMGVDDNGPYIQTNWDLYPDRAWRFMPDGELQLPFDGSRITSHAGQISLLMNYSDFRVLITDLNSVQHTTLFDTSGDVYFEGSLVPGGLVPDTVPVRDLGKTTHPWNNLYLANTIYFNTIPLTVDTNGSLYVNGNLINGGGGTGNGYTGSAGAIGYTGSAVIGYTGSAGINGTVGPQGTQGPIGFTGSAGIDGSRGFTGSQGFVGYTGSKGLSGYTGSVGPAGAGVTYKGTVANANALPGYPSSYLGAIGDAYVTLDTRNLWAWDGSAWIDNGNIVGSQGELGYTGSQGDIGYTGSQGNFGYTGSQGDFGYTGSQGNFGYTGSQGLKGDPGDSGVVNLEIDGGNAFTIYTAEITVDGGEA